MLRNSELKSKNLSADEKKFGVSLGSVYCWSKVYSKIIV